MQKITPELKYVCYKIIQRYKDPDTNKVDGIRFNKMISLLNRSLREEEDIDIKLPHYWYLYGDMVAHQEMPKEVKMEKESDDFIGDFYWDGSTPRPDKRIKKRIDRRVMALYNQYPLTCEIETVIDAVYNYAPYQFQRDFRLFRNDTKLIPMFEFEELHINVLKKGFQQALAHFPYDEFSELKVPFVRLEYVITTIFDEYPELKRLGMELGKDFWRIFCKFLRLNKKAHFNISKRSLSLWEQDSNSELIKYNEKLRNDIKDFIDKNNPPSLSDPFLKTFLLPDKWGKGSEKFSSTIDDVLYG